MKVSHGKKLKKEGRQVGGKRGEGTLGRITMFQICVVEYMTVVHLILAKQFLT